MNVHSYQALAGALDSYGEDRLKREMIKRQIEQDKLAEENRTFDRSMKTKSIELAETAEKRALRKDIDDNLRGSSADVDRAIAVSRSGVESDARVKLLNEQAKAAAAKQASPEEQKMEGWMNMRGAAMQRLQQAKQSNDPAALAMAQEDYQFVQQMRQNWLKEQKEPTVELELPGEEGTSKLRMSVPQSQWNEKHSEWGKFNGNGAPAAGQAAAPGGEQIPTLTAEQAATAKPGTKFKTTDGRILVR